MSDKMTPERLAEIDGMVKNALHRSLNACDWEVVQQSRLAIELLSEVERLRRALEAARDVIGRACVWLDLHRKDGVDDVLRALSGFLSATENGGAQE